MFYFFFALLIKKEFFLIFKFLSSIATLGEDLLSPFNLQLSFGLSSFTVLYVVIMQLTLLLKT